jgi:hypothetical protein
VPADHPGKLEAGEEFRIERHIRTPVVVGPFEATVTQVLNADRRTV